MWDELYPDTNPTFNADYAFTPWIMGPESPHIVWTRDYQNGGLMGADFGIASSVFPGIRDWGMRPQIVLMGRAYEAVEKPAPNGAATQTYWRCFDMRTGVTLWERPLVAGEAVPDIIEYGGRSATVVGEQFKPESPSILSISGGYLRKYNPINGNMILNVSIAPMSGSGGTYYMNGYVLGVQDLGAAAGVDRYRCINWTTLGTSTNFASRIASNTTYAQNALPTYIDWNTGLGGTVANVATTHGLYTKLNITGYELYTGKVLWSKIIDEQYYSGSSYLADHGKLALISGNGYWQAYDLRSGKLAWQSEVLDYPWEAAGWGSYSTTSAYGKLYWVAQTGIYAINWNTGVIEWKHEADAPPFETPYTGRQGQTVYPFGAPIQILDGKLYTYTAEHTPEPPFYRGAPTLCIDAITGDLVWKIGMTGASQFGRTSLQASFGDGYMTFGSRSGVMYCFGIGLSETTVAATSVGKSVLVTGSVLDLSPAQPGAQCVAKESMAALMEQLHMGASVGGILGDVMLIGVPVLLGYTDSNGNSYEMATVITDGYSGTFSYEWTPERAGKYTITATFLGDESYGESFATTYVIAQETPAIQEQESSPPYEWYIIGMGIAIIAVVLVIGLLLLKKK